MDEGRKLGKIGILPQDFRFQSLSSAGRLAVFSLLGLRAKHVAFTIVKRTPEGVRAMGVWTVIACLIPDD